MNRPRNLIRSTVTVSLRLTVGLIETLGIDATFALNTVLIRRLRSFLPKVKRCLIEETSTFLMPSRRCQVNQRSTWFRLLVIEWLTISRRASGHSRIPAKMGEERSLFWFLKKPLTPAEQKFRARIWCVNAKKNALL